MSKNPDYTKSKRSYMKRVATKCRICGRQLLDPIDAKKEMHSNCAKEYKPKMKGFK